MAGPVRQESGGLCRKVRKTPAVGRDMVMVAVPREGFGMATGSLDQDHDFWGRDFCC